LRRSKNAAFKYNTQAKLLNKQIKKPGMDDIKIFIQQEIMNLAFKKVSFEESIIKSKLLDSISVVDLLVTIEEKTGKKIPQHLFNEDHLDSIDMIVHTLNTL
jgi:acyl carrier protein